MNEAQGIHFGTLSLSGSLLTTWLVMLLLLSFSAFIRHKLQQEDNLWRTGAESLFAMMENAVQEVVPNHYKQVTPFIATLWVYLVCANLLGLIPGLHSPTADLSVTAGLAVIVFVSVHWFGIRNLGLKTYLKHYLSPNPIMLPFHLMSEISRTLALAIRLFGNIMSLEMAILLVLLVAGFLVPVPLMMLHLVEALIQAYIFGVLALLYIGTSLENKTTSSEQGSKNT
ncbi:MAG: ATP synthase F0 subunit A [Pseudomonadales bacterium]|uniref:F0F1 ATP synthase subunit A n=1 Tax=unclassified Ketobacter TaxID=2639109 RepID=UPI000C606277|nr:MULTISPECIES: F0F1 ATP synthase subunit A [unclassified Ketobacter]MAQ23461.1 ATP synthase F0 subunit A [Pseudomonadales bacterium]MEC8813392.1 F0F1 ATP synthase subunit A [Pseudomonadota bacterium]HAG95286.1 ATP synthase F0 subunit A [Gammaproteobacteria bacterium]MBI27455.1 ATP synthase F0 subunit A [Pseudomonadales bacterium]MCK5791847.1 F0F1 ATP synthase subunit A [Ketobacter sp.]|tara:strand:+ start:2054 stop:2734 length:681 start_codon:yes stop_codon:yes gene_type:complete